MPKANVIKAVNAIILDIVVMIVPSFFQKFRIELLTKKLTSF